MGSDQKKQLGVVGAKGRKQEQYIFETQTLTFTEEEEPEAILDLIVDLWNAQSYAARQTFIWLVNPVDQFLIQAFTQLGDYVMLDPTIRIESLLNRPIFYSNEVKQGRILFRAYL